MVTVVKKNPKTPIGYTLVDSDYSGVNIRRLEKDWKSKDYLTKVIVTKGYRDTRIHTLYVKAPKGWAENPGAAWHKEQSRIALKRREDSLKMGFSLASEAQLQSMMFHDQAAKESEKLEIPNPGANYHRKAAALLKERYDRLGVAPTHTKDAILQSISVHEASAKESKSRGISNPTKKYVYHYYYPGDKRRKGQITVSESYTVTQALSKAQKNVPGAIIDRIVWMPNPRRRRPSTSIRAQEDRSMIRLIMVVGGAALILGWLGRRQQT